jgi:flagellar M-ring protein FliF
MPPFLTDSLTLMLGRWSAFPARLRLMVLAGVGAGALLGLTIWALSTVFVDYQVLFSNLSAEDAGAVVEALRAGHVPHRVGEGGQVLVPAGQVHEWRLKLASQGVPSGGSVGFEIFDKNSFGMTDFSQRLNFQRALQGELARTIGQLKEVQQARVHLALPAPRVFSSQEKPPSASVVLRLKSGALLRPDQVRGIVHLVTASVEGLSPDRVTVIESSGRVLASGLERAAGLTGNQQDARTGVEGDVERRVQSLLEPIVGAGRSAVRVAALLNFDQIERTEERFDPKPLVRNQTKSSESTEGNSAQPGPPVPLPPGKETDPTKVPPPTPGPTSNTRTQRDSEQTTYEIARTVEKVVVAPGEVRRLSIAVLLDVPLVDGKRTPRNDSEIERIKRLVASASGVRGDRDEVEVLQVPFDPTSVIAADGTGKPAVPVGAPARNLTWIMVAAGVLIAVVAVTFVMWRGRRRQALFGAVSAAMGSRDARSELSSRRAGAVAAARAAAAVPPGPAELPVEQPVTPLELKAKFPEKEVLKERVLAAAREHPEEIAQILRAWIVKRRVAT